MGWVPKNPANLNDSIDKIPIWDSGSKYVYMTDAGLFLSNTPCKEKYVVRIAVSRSMMIIKFVEADKSTGSRSSLSSEVLPASLQGDETIQEN